MLLLQYVQSISPTYPRPQYVYAATTMADLPETFPEWVCVYALTKTPNATTQEQPGSNNADPTSFRSPLQPPITAKRPSRFALGLLLSTPFRRAFPVKQRRGRGG
jgi:hypothetical protein